MAGNGEIRTMLAGLFASRGLEITDAELDILTQLEASFAVQRARLDGAVRPETEPMIIPAFDRIQTKPEAADERGE